MVSPRPTALDAQGQWGRGDPIFPSSFFSEQKPQTTFIAEALFQELNFDRGPRVPTSASSLGIQWGKARSFLLCEAHIQWQETDDPSHNEQGRMEGQRRKRKPGWREWQGEGGVGNTCHGVVRGEGDLEQRPE